MSSQYPLPDLKTLVARGWQKKCPQCGEGPLYRRWFTLHDSCPKCGLRYLPDQGDVFGPLVFLDRVLFLIPFIVLFFFHLWHPGLLVFLLVGAAMVLVMVYTTPNRNGVSVAFDYFIRRKSGDLVDAPQDQQARK